MIQKIKNKKIKTQNKKSVSIMRRYSITKRLNTFGIEGVTQPNNLKNSGNLQRKELKR